MIRVKKRALGFRKPNLRFLMVPKIFVHAMYTHKQKKKISGCIICLTLDGLNQPTIVPKAIGPQGAIWYRWFSLCFEH